MAYYLAPGISYGKLAATTVVLDLCRDRYLRLGRDAAQVLDDLARGADIQADRPGLVPLLDARLLADAGAPIQPVISHLPELSALEMPVIAGRRVSTWRVLRAFYGVRLSLKRRGLAATITMLRSARSTTRYRLDSSEAAEIARHYAKIRQRLPGARACVPEAFTLSVVLTGLGIAHDVVFGVSLTPFAAHAWAQTDDHILTDRADPVRAFRPVFRL